MQMSRLVKTLAAGFVLGFSALSAHAVVGTPPTFEKGLLPIGTTQDSATAAGPFIHTWGFSVPTNGGLFASVLNIPVSPIYNLAWSSLAVVKNPDGLVGTADDQLISVPVVAGTQTLSLSTGPLSQGTYYLSVAGVTSGSSGGLYSLALTVAQPIPEPEGYAMMLAGLGLVGAMVFKRRKP